MARNTTTAQRTEQIFEIRRDSTYLCEFDVITKNDSIDHTENLWYIVDDLVMVIFRDNAVSAATIDQFKLKYGLEDFRIPSPTLPAGGRYTYQ